MSPMPEQKPGRSKQDYGTPPELIKAVKHRLGIDHFELDIAADKDNTVAERFYTEEDDALSILCPWSTWGQRGRWAWLNPPFGNIAPWVEKATMEARIGAHIMMLVPTSHSNWWVKWVAPYAYVTHLHGRITFLGCDTPYPKDCSLLMYTPWAMTGSEIWSWK